MYTALYRKWRPKTFDDVISQPHITATLSHQIASNKTAHAYLFTGSRGTGKTTCARIFAKAINCLNPHDGKPCLECEICRAADSGTLNDIIEIDAASNTGVDDIRELRESAIYTPELCRYKVYIIDEVHMLSNQAFNALLKIMEEPPEHVKFILATTEIYKVPATIISRCQRFDFRRIRPEDIAARLEYIAKAEGVNLSPDAAAVIARISDGAMRDALSLLDQCMAYSSEITAETVADAAGVAGRDSLFDILDAIAARDCPAVLKTTDMLYSRSKDMARLCDELIFQLRNIMLIKTAPQNKELLNCLPSEAQRLEELSGRFSLDEVFSCLDILQGTAESMQRAVSKRTEFEMAMIKLCSGYSGHSSKAVSAADSSLANRLSAVEARLESISAQLANSPADIKPKPAGAPKKPVQAKSAPAESVPADGAVRGGELKIFEQWDEVLDRLKEVNPGCAGALKGSRGLCRENNLLIEVQSEFFMKLFKQPGNAASLQDVVRQITGHTYAIKARCVKAAGNAPSADSQDKLTRLMEHAKEADIPFDIN